MHVLRFGVIDNRKHVESILLLGRYQVNSLLEFNTHFYIRCLDTEFDTTIGSDTKQTESKCVFFDLFTERS